MLGLSESGVDKIRRAIGHPAESDTKPLRFFMPDWLRAWAQYTAGVLGADGESEADEGGWLEEKRKWDAKQSQLAYLKKRGEQIPVEHARQIVLSAGEHLRRAGELMCERCRDIQDEAITESHDELARHFADDRTFDDDTDESGD